MLWPMLAQSQRGDIFGATGFILTLRWTCQHGNTCTSITRKRWLLFWLLSAWLWAHHRVVIHGDNQAAVQMINKGTTDNAVIMEDLRALFWLSAIYNFHISGVYIEGSRNTIADAISRLHERSSLFLFYSILRERFVHSAVDGLSLGAHMSVDSTSFLSSRCTRSSAGLATSTGSWWLWCALIRQIYQDNIQNTSWYLPAVLSVYGIQLRSRAAWSPASICRFPRQEPQSYLCTELSQYCGPIAQGLVRPSQSAA